MNADQDFIQRQLRFLEAAGDTSEAAQVKLRALVPAGDLETPEPRPTDALSTYLDGCASDLGSQRPIVESSVREFLRETDTALRPVWRSLRAIAIHFATTTGFAWFTVWVLTIYVLPQFQASYRSFGADLPVFTKMILSPFPRFAILGILTACALALFWHERQVRSAFMLRRRVIAPRISELIFPAVHHEYFLILALVVVRGSILAGMQLDTAIAFASRFVADWSGLELPSRLVNDGKIDPLQIALQLGTLNAELDHQIFNRWSNLPLRAGERREGLALVANVVLGLVVGSLIIALYLPIFKLATVV